MKGRSTLFGVLTVGVLLLAACAPAKQDSMMEKPTEAMMEKATPTAEVMMEKVTPTAEAMMEKNTPTAEGMMEDQSGMMEAPAWFSAELTHAASGETFSIADFKGKVVLVETMAQWCSNCLKQQNQVKALHDLLGNPEDLISVGLDIDPNENAEALKSYVAKNGFDWYYAVAPAEVSKEISALYGAQFLNPPSTPIVIIDRKGEAHVLPFGIKSAEDLQKAVEEYLNQGM